MDKSVESQNKISKDKLQRKKDPCRRQQIDFHLCQKKYGFNDHYCKYYLQEFESCVSTHRTHYNPQ